MGENHQIHVTLMNIWAHLGGGGLGGGEEGGGEGDGGGGEGGGLF